MYKSLVDASFPARFLCWVGLGLLLAGSAVGEPLGTEAWLQPGDHEWGRTFYSSTLVLDDIVHPHMVMINYPADTEGLDVAVAAAGAPFPVIFFEHAAAETYEVYGYLFQLLASHGIAVVSIDHSDPVFDNCSPCPMWDRHVELMLQTAELIRGWTEDVSSPFYGAFDLSRVGLAGHSHGAGAMLEATKVLGPIDPDGPFDIAGLSLLAPRPVGATPMADYPSEYAGLPPLQVLYGSKDRDGSVANGQAIASYEPLTRPRHFAYVIGASHHGFAEDGTLAEATIDHRAHHRSAASAITAWFALTLKGDLSALPYLRGELPLVEDSPEVRYQFHDSDPDVVDDAETGPGFGVAIAHLPGRAFVNGFLSDTFADFEAGVQLIREQIASLLPDGDPDPKRVLFYEDAVRGESVYAEALSREVEAGRIRSTTTSTSSEEFASLLGSSRWDLVVMANQTGAASAAHEFDVPMRQYLCGDGKAIISDFRVNSQSAAEILECVFTRLNGSFNWSQMTLAADPSRVFAMTDPGWGVWTYELETDAAIYATNENVVLPVPDPAKNTKGLGVQDTGLVTFAEIDALDEARTLYHPTGALEIAWNVPGGSLFQTVAPMWTTGFEASQFKTLSFRTLQIDGDPLNPSAQEIDFKVRLVDRAGRRGEIVLSNTAMGALSPAVDPSVLMERKSVFETYRLLTSDFLHDEPLLDLTRIDGVEFMFDLSPTGRIVLDDLEFVSRCENVATAPPAVGNRLRVGLSDGQLVLDWSDYPWPEAAQRFRVYRAETTDAVPGEIVAEPTTTEWQVAPAGTLEMFDVRAVAECAAAVEESPD